MLNKIYGLVQAGKGLFSIFCDDKFVQSEADQPVFRRFNDGEVEMVVFTHVDDILAHAKATMERFVAELGEKFNKSRWWRSPASRRQTGHQRLRGDQPSLQVDEPQTPEEEEDMLKFPCREAVGALM